jgi:hypothetical protein
VKTENNGGSAYKDINEERGRSFSFPKGPPGVPLTMSTFEGKFDALKGFYYGCSDVKQADMYARTTKKIPGYVGREYNMGGDIHIAVETGTAPRFKIPDDPPEGASKTVEKLWEKRVVVRSCLWKVHSCPATETRVRG